MIFRTDLAVEAKDMAGEDIQGVEYNREEIGEVTIERMMVRTDEAAQEIGKPKGSYVTITVPALTDNFESTDKRIEVIAQEIRNLIPEEGMILVAGLGNSDITPDALGPKTASMVLATRHIKGELARSTGLDALRPVSVLTTGVLGQTGIETGELLLSVVDKIKPSAVIVIDALASRNLWRLGCTIQLSNTGISPGSGVGNSRPQISKQTLGVPVISMGVPTVVDATTLAADLLENNRLNKDSDIKEKTSPRGEPMIVTPREIDLLIQRASKLTGMAINCALHTKFSPEDLFALIS